MVKNTKCTACIYFYYSILFIFNTYFWKNTILYSFRMTILTNYKYNNYKRTVFLNFDYYFMLYILSYNVMITCAHQLYSRASFQIWYYILLQVANAFYIHYIVGSEDESTSVQKIRIMACDWTWGIYLNY